MVSTKGINHIHLVVSDLERSLCFYQDVFGFKEMFRKPVEVNGKRLDVVFLNTPGTNDSLALKQVGDDTSLAPRTGKPAVPGDNGGVDHFGFGLVDQGELDSAIQEVIDHGGAFLSKAELAPGSGFYTAFVADPDGYAIQL